MNIQGEPPGSLGLEAETVRVVPYDPSWADIYLREVARLEPLLLARGVSLAFQHTGSTAVPGLAAKPVLDVLAGWNLPEQRWAAVGALQAAALNPSCDNGAAVWAAAGLGKDCFGALRARNTSSGQRAGSNLRP